MTKWAMRREDGLRIRALSKICLSVLLILLLCTVSYAPIVAADALPLEATMISLDHQYFPFIYLNVAVDRYGEGISTLTKSNFQVTENGFSQTGTAYFNVIPPESGDTNQRPVDIIFLMDNSGSMSAEQNAVRQNVEAFVDELRNRGVDCQLGLCRFGASQNSGNPIIEDNGSLTSDVDYFKDDVWNRNVTSGGFEPGWDALYAAVTDFAFRKEGPQKVFILITDETPTDNGNVGTHTKQEAIDILKSHYVTTFALIELSDAHAISDYGEIAEQTNGAYYNILDPFDGILDYISNLIPNNYRISYKSSNPMFDNTERHVEVTVTYQGDQATCDGKYTPGSAPIIRRTQDTLDLHKQSWAAGTDFTIRAEITDAVEPYVESATLYYRKKGDADFTPIPMTHSSDIWAGTIPGSAVETPWVGYYILATDGENTVTDPSVDPMVHPYILGILPNEAPQIIHTPPADVPDDTPITITAQIVDTTNTLASTMLYYRKVGDPLYYDNGHEMNNIGGDNYQDVIPREFVTPAGVEYYILAVDDLGTENSFGTRDDPQQVWVSTNHPPTAKIETHVIDSAKGTAKFTWSGSDDSTPPAQLVYKHRLLNPDSPLYDWSAWSSSTTTTYPRSPDSRLPDGTYRFQVKAKDADGAIQPDSAVWEFTIRAAPSEFWVQVYNTGSTLAIRKTPGTKNKPSDDVLKRVPDGWVLKVLSTVDENGNTVVKDGFTWWKVEESKYESQPNTGWVAKKYLKEVSFVSTPLSSPEGLTKAEWETVADKAVQWATHEDRIGSNAWKGLCAKFVANAFGQAAAGYNADDLAKYLKGQGLLYPNPEKGAYGNPPRGALVFFEPAEINEWYGHVGIYLGSGEMVNQYVDIRIMSLTGYSTAIGYKGWAYPPEEWLTVSGAHPATPKNLAQLLPDGVAISIGGTVNADTVVFKATVTDPDADKVKLQVELRRLDELSGDFDDETQEGFKESNLVTSGTSTTCTAYGLIDDSYHWRARVVDEHGMASDWVQFAENDSTEADFVVAHSSSRLLPVLLLHGYQVKDGFDPTRLWESLARLLSGNQDGDFEQVFVESGTVFWHLPPTKADHFGPAVYISNYTVELTTANDIRFFAARLADEIDRIKTIEQTERVDIVAHSMGGLVARAYIENDDFAEFEPDFPDYGTSFGHDVRKLVMLGTPNHGAMESWLASLVRGEESARQMHPGSGFLNVLNYGCPKCKRDGGSDQIPSGVDYVVFAGQSCSYCGPVTISVMPPAPGIGLPTPTPFEVRIACLEECRENGEKWQGNDHGGSLFDVGITMSSARLDGAELHACIGVDHTALREQSEICEAVQAKLLSQPVGNVI
jgi:pimeloyl-ACP methyl ester carboxylesterase/Mg-chelatase subunit ChlD